MEIDRGYGTSFLTKISGAIFITFINKQKLQIFRKLKQKFSVEKNTGDIHGCSLTPF
jgi:hypothetical protein